MCGKTQGVATSADESVNGGAPDGPDKFKPRDVLPKRALTLFPADSSDDARSVQKRTLDPFPTDIEEQDQFIVKAVSGATLDIVPPDVNDKNINSGVFREIGGTGPDDGFSLGLGNSKDEEGKPIRLTGCTTLIVMSQKAVWFGHFWEYLAYGGGKDLFEKQILGLINSGGTDNPDMQQSLAAHAADFRGQPSASAWIIQPAADDVENGDGTETHQDYTDLNESLQNTVFALTGITAQIDDYTPDDAQDTARGRAIYQYDPQAQANDPKRGFRYIWERNDQGITFF